MSSMKYSAIDWRQGPWANLLSNIINCTQKSTLICLHVFHNQIVIIHVFILLFEAPPPSIQTPGILSCLPPPPLPVVVVCVLCVCVCVCVCVVCVCVCVCAVIYIHLSFLSLSMPQMTGHRISLCSLWAE